MNIDEFWQIVERAHQKSGGDMEAKCRLLGDELRRLIPAEIRSFDRHFTGCFFKAYSHDIWGAAYIIGHGCSDDSFMDFRSTLISLGRAPFETALADADSLADFDMDPDQAFYQGYQYAAWEAYCEMTGDAEMPRDEIPEHPESPTGIPFKEWQMSERFPRLAAKYDYHDSDALGEKLQEEKQAEAETIGEKIKVILLEGGIIPSCGLIPPARVVEQILRTGRSPESSGREYTWQPFDYDERYYWSAVTKLEGTNTSRIKSRPDLKGTTLKLDLDSSGAENFDQWMQTLAKRDLL